MGQYEASEKTRNAVGLLAIATQEGINLQKEFDRVSKACSALHQKQSDRLLNGELPQQTDDVELEALQNWKMDVLKRITANNTRKRKLEETSDRLLQEGPKKQVIAFYQQVGIFNEKEEDEVEITEVRKASRSSATTASSNTTNTPMSVLTDDKEADTETITRVLMGDTQKSDNEDAAADEDDDDDDDSET